MYPIMKAIPDREGSNPFNSIHKPKENVTLKLTATEQWNVPLPLVESLTYLSSPLDGGLNSRAPKGDGGLISRACLRIL